MKCVNCKKLRPEHIHDKFCPVQSSGTSPEQIRAWVDEFYSSDDESDLSIWQPEFPKYINVYKVEQVFGGPEEGGWWFDAGEPLESVQVDNKEQEDLLRFGFMDRYDLDIHNNYVPRDRNNPDRERVRGRTSAAGGYDIRIRVEYAFAQPFPQERPRYE